MDECLEIAELLLSLGDDSVSRLRARHQREVHERQWSEQTLRARALALQAEGAGAHAFAFEKLMRITGKASVDLAEEWASSTFLHNLDFDAWCADRCASLLKSGGGETGAIAVPVSAVSAVHANDAAVPGIAGTKLPPAGLPGATAPDPASGPMPHPLGTAAPAASCPVVPRAKPASDTVFAVAQDDVAHDVTDPVSALADLAKRLLRHKDYRSERVEYCRLNLQLNRIGVLAPAFRPQVTCGAKRGDPIHYVLYRDQLVLDYHWCHAKRMVIRPQEPEHAALLDLDHPFDFIAASALACKEWKPAFRASEAMILTAFQQCQMSQLRGIEVQERERALSGTYRASHGRYSNRVSIAKRKILSWLAGRAAMEAQIPVYEALWISREMLGPEEAKWIPQLVALSLGAARPLARKTINDKLAAMDKHVVV